MPEYDIGELPEGWYVLWCRTCFCSLVWIKDVAIEHIASSDYWESVLVWAIEECIHGPEHETPVDENASTELDAIVEPILARVVETRIVRVGELIEKLSKFDPKLPVFTNDNEYGLQNDVRPRESIADKWEARDAGLAEGTPIVVID